MYILKKKPGHLFLSKEFLSGVYSRLAFKQSKEAVINAIT
jgi:hypothetical protein